MFVTAVCRFLLKYYYYCVDKFLVKVAPDLIQPLFQFISSLVVTYLHV